MIDGRRRFHDELEALQARLLEMGGLTEHLVEIAVEGFLTRNRSIRSEARARDAVIDELEIEIDERATELLALQQPMAVDLRRIIATLKIANDLERVGDHAVNIARAARRITKRTAIPESPEIREMAKIAGSMLSGALQSYTVRDTRTALEVCELDDRVDDLRRSLFKRLLPVMEEGRDSLAARLEVLLVSQNLERIADLATNIAEDVVFLVDGRSIKHGRAVLGVVG